MTKEKANLLWMSRYICGMARSCGLHVYVSKCVIKVTRMCKKFVFESFSRSMCSKWVWFFRSLAHCSVHVYARLWGLLLPLFKITFIKRQNDMTKKQSKKILKTILRAKSSSRRGKLCTKMQRKAFQLEQNKTKKDEDESMITARGKEGKRERENVSREQTREAFIFLFESRHSNRRIVSSFNGKFSLEFRWFLPEVEVYWSG